MFTTWPLDYFKSDMGISWLRSRVGQGEVENFSLNLKKSVIYSSSRLANVEFYLDSQSLPMTLYNDLLFIETWSYMS